MFGSSIPLKTLAALCRSLGTMLHSGLPIGRVFDHASKKTGDARCRLVLSDVTIAIQSGKDVATALRQHGTYFPELFIDMIDVSEQSGMLPEVLKSLGNHYENLLRLRRSFFSAITWPAIQLTAAIMIVALLIYVLGQIPNAPDMLGLGLMGGTGALIWLGICFGTIGGLIGGYFFLARSFQQKRFLDGVLMHIPVVGTCMQSFAVARFAWSFSLTQQTGMPIARSLQASFRSTANGAFTGAAADVCDMISRGEDLGTALAATNLFPADFLEMVQVAEVSGTVPEMLERLSPQFEDQARRSLNALAVALGWVIWVCVALLIIFIIFSIFTQYVSQITNAM